jgi:hypothetical protein
MRNIISIICRVIFVGAAIMAALAVGEKFFNLFGFTILQTMPYSPWRLMEFASVALLFVIALQLREIKLSRG